MDWLDQWENMLLDRTISEDQFLTKTTTEGLRVTVSSTIELSSYLLSKGFKYILTSKMNQDPLEVGKIKLHVPI